MKTRKKLKPVFHKDAGTASFRKIQKIIIKQFPIFLMNRKRGKDEKKKGEGG